MVPRMCLKITEVPIGMYVSDKFIMKKTIIISAIFLSILLAAFLGWYFLSRDSSTLSGPDSGNFPPFGSGEGIPGLTADNQIATTTPLDEFGRPAASLFRISADPVAGAVVFNTPSTVVARYVDRATGHIYDVDLATLEKTKITNQTLPKIYEAHFRPDGNAVLLRYLKDNSDVVENLSLTLTPPQATSSSKLYNTSTTLLQGDIDSVTVGSGNSLFYILQNTSSITSSTFTGTSPRTLFKSTFNDWILRASGNSLIAHSKAGANTPGYAYRVSTSGGGLTKALGPLNGLVAIPNPSGNRVLYSYVDRGATKLLAANSKGEIVSEILPATIAEKCVWSSKNVNMVVCGSPTDPIAGSEPDNWYRGSSHFSDRIWAFDTDVQIAQVLSEPRQNLGLDIDAVELKLSTDEDYLIFINKRDLSLWALRLELF